MGEGSHSGLVRTLGKRVYRKVPRVRIPLPPPPAGKVRPAASARHSAEPPPWGFWSYPRYTGGTLFFTIDMLNPEQRAQIERQMAAYEQQEGIRHITVPLGSEELDLEVDALVANPEIMNSGVQVIRYLAERPELVRGKIVTDMGTGSGIIGLAAAKIEAARVFMIDVDEAAVKNARRNVERLGLATCEVLQGDLFSSYGDRPKSQVHIFNHPFFSENPIEGKPWTQMMLGGEALIERYLKQAPQYATREALYLMPWLTLAGSEDSLDNDPARRAPQLGYQIERVTDQEPVKQGIQQTKFKMYELRKT